MFNLLGNDVHVPPDFKASNIKIAASFVIGFTALGLGISGTVIEKGALKATALITGAGFLGLACASATQASWEAKNWEAKREIRHETIVQSSLIEAETALELHKVITEENAIRQVQGTVQPNLALPQSVVTTQVMPQQAQMLPIQTPELVSTQSSLEGISTLQNTGVQPTPSTPVNTVVANNIQQATANVSVVQDSSNKLPDGAILIDPSELNNNDKYPVVMVVAEQGAGKSVTLATIFEYLTGNKVLATPKKQDHENSNLASVYDIRFGYNNDLKQGRWIGHIPDDITSPNWGDLDADNEHDLTWYLNNKPGGDSYINFVWSVRQESLNRQQHGMDSDTKYWRVFGDELSQTFGGGFNDPQKDPKLIRQAKEYVSACIADAFMNFRGQRVQMWIGCQSESVEMIGMKGLSKARDVAWHLYPGKAAIEAAKKYKKDNLALWLMNRKNAGYGIALLEKNGVFFEVINLPTLEYMKKFDPS